MLLTVTVKSKVLGHRTLLRDLAFTVNPGEKVALIGRNGIGKTSLFNIINHQDVEFDGEVKTRRGLKIASTKQEHFVKPGVSCLDYIYDNLPRFRELQEVIEQAKDIDQNEAALHKYSEAVEEFTQLGYYDIEDKALRALDNYQIPAELARGDFNQLSGGQKRFVDLVRVELSDSDLALLDEPTNHMDYVAKDAFRDWLATEKRAVVVITHDRDVLGEVDRILELRDQTIYSYPGNYDKYLEQNSLKTVGQIKDYEVAQRTIIKLEQQIRAAREKKPSWGGTADKKNPFVVIEERLTKQLVKLKAEVKKPSFWIDRESVEQLRDDVVEKYDKYKAHNIRVRASDDGQSSWRLLEVKNLSLGYDEPLFQDLGFLLASGDRLEIKGRNGVGKTTLVNAIIGQVEGEQPASQVFTGQIKADQKVRLGVYRQETEHKLLDLRLDDAVKEILSKHNLPVNDQTVYQLLSQYLFDAPVDRHKKVEVLSGGEKARLQLIDMLAGKPNLLILDEPTNHLDLPSIEELENALTDYAGAIIYISHDSYFSRFLGGQTLEIQPAQ